MTLEVTAEETQPPNNGPGESSVTAAAVAANDSEHSASAANEAAGEASSAADAAGAGASVASQGASESAQAASVSVQAAQVASDLKRQTEELIGGFLSGISAAVQSQSMGTTPEGDSGAGTGESQQEITASDPAPAKQHWLTRPLWGKGKK